VHPHMISFPPLCIILKRTSSIELVCKRRAWGKQTKRPPDFGSTAETPTNCF
jgi:hypothetical protein